MRQSKTNCLKLEQKNSLIKPINKKQGRAGDCRLPVPRRSTDTSSTWPSAGRPGTPGCRGGETRQKEVQSLVFLHRHRPPLPPALPPPSSIRIQSTEGAPRWADSRLGSITHLIIQQHAPHSSPSIPPLLLFSLPGPLCSTPFLRLPFLSSYLWHKCKKKKTLLPLVI